MRSDRPIEATDPHGPDDDGADDGRRLLHQLEETLRAQSDAAAVLKLVAVRLGSHLRVDRCAYATMDADTGEVSVVDDYAVGLPSRRGRFRLAAFGPLACGLLTAGQPFVIADAARDPRLGDADRAAFTTMGVAAVLAVPLTRAGVTVAGLSVQRIAPRDWSEAEVTLVRDVAERCWETLERLHAEERAAREQRHAGLALRAGRMGVWEWNVATGERRWGEGMFALYGIDPAAGTPSAESFLVMLDDDDRARMVRELGRLATEGGETEVEFRIRTADGDRWILTRGARVDSPEGGAMLVGVSLDHTAHRLAEAKLRDADARKDEFMAMLAHELRNPLAPLVNVVTLLRRDDLGDTRRRELVDVADRQVRQLHRLVDDLLEVSRITQGRIALRPESVDLADAVVAAIASVEARIAARGQRVAHLGLERAPHIVADPARIAQILENLLDNASKYTPEGGSIRVELEGRDDTVALRVVDDGMGIDADELPRLFEPFSQVGATLDRAAGGLGLGLALVRRLAELHGGHVDAASAGRGRGSTFTVVLPTVAVDRRE